MSMMMTENLHKDTETVYILPHLALISHDQPLSFYYLHMFIDLQIFTTCDGGCFFSVQASTRAPSITTISEP